MIKVLEIRRNIISCSFFFTCVITILVPFVFLQMCVASAQKEKEDVSFGISAAICRWIYPLWSGARFSTTVKWIYALCLLIYLTAVTGRCFTCHFKVLSNSSPSSSAIISHWATTTSCLVFRIARVPQTMLVNARHQSSLSCPFF